MSEVPDGNVFDFPVKKQRKKVLFKKWFYSIHYTLWNTNLKLLQSPSSTTGYSVSARAEWKHSPQQPLPCGTWGGSVSTQGSTMHSCLHFRGQESKHSSTRLLEKKNPTNSFLHCEAVHDNGFSEVLSAQDSTVLKLDWLRWTQESIKGQSKENAE